MFVNAILGLTLKATSTLGTHCTSCLSGQQLLGVWYPGFPLGSTFLFCKMERLRRDKILFLLGVFPETHRVCSPRGTCVTQRPRDVIGLS